VAKTRSPVSHVRSRKNSAWTRLATTLIGVYPFARKHEVIIAYHVVGQGEIGLNEELAEFRLIAPEKLKPWDFGTGLAVSDWLARRSGV
jgi:NAD+ diphosphatase